MKRTVTICILLAVLAAACGDDTAATTSSAVATTVAETTTTTAPATTTTPAETTTTAAAATTTQAPVVFAFDATSPLPEVFGAEGDPHGSGCVVDGAELPDGVWFGIANSVSAATITFDLACFFTGPAAIAASTADGAEAADFHVRNQNPKLYSVPISPTAQVYYVDMITGPGPTPIAVTSWPTADSFATCPGEYCPVWLYVNGGVATGIVEQYLP